MQGFASFKGAGAAAVSAAMLLAPGCERPERGPDERSPVRRAAFAAAAARDMIETCFGAEAGGPARAAFERHDQLMRLSEGKRAMRDIAAGANEWRAVRLRSAPPDCARGDGAFDAAVARFSRSLDILAARIRDHRE